MTAGIRSATLASLVVFAVIAAETLLNQVRLLIAPPPGTEDILSVHSPFSSDSNLWLLARGWAFVLWIPCLILAVSGGRVGARWAAWLAVIPAAVTIGTMIAGPVDLWFGLGGVALVVVQVAVVLGLASIASLDAAPVVHRGRWLTLAAVGVLAVLVPQMVALVRPGPRGLSVVGYVVVDSPGLWCGAAVVAAAVLVVRRGRGAHLSSAALLGVAALAVVAALLRASSLPVWIELAHTAGATPYVLVTVIQLAAVFAIAVTAGTLTARRFRALPPAAYGPTAGRTRHIRRDLPAPGDVADHE